MTLIEFQIQSESNSATQNIGKPKDRQTTQRYRFVFFHQNIPVDTGRNLNVHKTFRRRPGCLLNVLCTFNLRPVSTGILFFPDGFFSINLKPLLPFFFLLFLTGRYFHHWSAYKHYRQLVVKVIILNSGKCHPLQNK